jgi:hypothetical protein
MQHVQNEASGQIFGAAFGYFVGLAPLEGCFEGQLGDREKLELLVQ